VGKGTGPIIGLMDYMGKGYKLDVRLESDTIFLCSLFLCDVLLMNEKQVPWFILVPRVKDAVELFDLSEENRGLVFEESIFIAEKIKSHYRCEKINIAVLGNMVRQLHIHIIGRHSADPAWPNPVWGNLISQKYSEQEYVFLKNELQELFKA